MCAKDLGRRHRHRLLSGRPEAITPEAEGLRSLSVWSLSTPRLPCLMICIFLPSRWHLFCHGGIGSRSGADRAVLLPTVDPFSDQIRQAGIAVPVVTYGVTNREADVRAEKYTLSAFQTNTIITTPLGRLEVCCPPAVSHLCPLTFCVSGVQGYSTTTVRQPTLLLRVRRESRLVARRHVASRLLVTGRRFATCRSSPR